MTARKPPGEHHKRGRKPQPHSARNGGVRVVGIVSPVEAEDIRRACDESGFTRGELLVSAARRVLEATGYTTHRKAKDT
jgi:hypothetical protein